MKKVLLLFIALFITQSTLPFSKNGESPFIAKAFMAIATPVATLILGGFAYTEYKFAQNIKLGPPCTTDEKGKKNLNKDYEENKNLMGKSYMKAGVAGLLITPLLALASFSTIKSLFNSNDTTTTETQL